MKEAENTSIAFMLGIVIGVATAVLVAPTRGSELRATIKRKSAAIKDAVASKAEKAKEETAEGIKNAKEAILDDSSDLSAM